jgi:hypothetical protein
MNTGLLRSALLTQVIVIVHSGLDGHRMKGYAVQRASCLARWVCPP